MAVLFGAPRRRVGHADEASPAVDLTVHVRVVDEIERRRNRRLPARAEDAVSPANRPHVTEEKIFLHVFRADAMGAMSYCDEVHVHPPTLTRSEATVYARVVPDDAPRDPLLVYSEPLAVAMDKRAERAEDPLLAMHRRWVRRNMQHTHRRELLLKPNSPQPTSSWPKPWNFDLHSPEADEGRYPGYYGVPGRRTPAQQARWDALLTTYLRLTKTYSPPVPRAEAGNVYR